LARYFEEPTNVGKQMIDIAKAQSSAPAATKQCISWKAYPWRSIEKKVFRLQLRIAKAIREKRFNRARALQWMLTHSRDAKLLAVKRVTESRGAGTAGVDKEVWKTSKQRERAVNKLSRRGYKALPLKRIYIPKKNGESRPLGIPTMKDRAMQALHLLSLEPITETYADPNAYGFRPLRSTTDAVAQCFNALAQRNSARWILEGDIKACFDEISHRWLLNNIQMDKSMLQRWLKAGFIESKTLHPTNAGTPQGGIISPCLAVATLSGLEIAAKQSVKKTDQVYVVAYADDFVITGASREVLETKVIPAVKVFLEERGLRLSDKKTKVTPIEKGFDFLGCNVRKYNGKLIIKPSMKSVKSFIANIRETFHSNKAANASNLIRILNSKILGWAYYHRSNCAKRTFSFVDNHIFKYVVRWINRKHPRKSWTWKRKRYFRALGPRNWVFYDALPGKNQHRAIQFLYLAKTCSVPIKRHIKIKGDANPYNPEYLPYLAKRKVLMGSSKRKGINRLVANYFDS
jgi:RNA-directed DNA polymerase